MKHFRIFTLGVLGGVLLLAPPSFAFAFDLRSPSNEATNVQIGTYFTWDHISNPNLHHYQLEIHLAGPAAWVPINITLGNCSGSQCSIGALQFANTFPLQKGLYNYEWRVLAKNVGDVTLEQSAESRFQTEDTGPSCPPDCPPPGGEPPPPISSGDLNPISAKNLTELFNKIFSFLFGLSIFLVPVVVIYAAFLMLMGGGDPEKLAKGRMILMWTAIAFIIILLSRGLPVVLKNLL